MEAEAENIDPEFREMVTEGKYKKISASFYLPSSPGNPSPGEYYLRHIGFLGATPPAMKGLRQAAFGEEKSGVIKFDSAICPYRLEGTRIANAGNADFTEGEMNEYQLEGKRIAEA